MRIKDIIRRDKNNVLSNSPSSCRKRYMDNSEENVDINTGVLRKTHSADLLSPFLNETD